MKHLLKFYFFHFCCKVLNDGVRHKILNLKFLYSKIVKNRQKHSLTVGGFDCRTFYFFVKI